MMVCPYDKERLLLVLQIDHSKVTGWLAAHWGNDDFAPLSPYDAMVMAAQEHDTGWWDWEIKPHLSAEGLPPDYIGSIKHLGGRVWLDFYRHGISRLAEQDAYAGYIVSLHADGLLTQGRGLLSYMPDYTVHPEVKEFISEQEDFRKELMGRLKQSEVYRDFISDEQLWTNFKLMEIYDQMGQFVCNRYPFNSTHRKNGPSPTLSNVPAPVRPGRDDTILTFNVKDETRATVNPYPFDVDPLPLSFQGRVVANRPYTDQKDFLQEYYRAERVMIEYSLHST
ncbi:MAG TPA: DUF3891 family protein [Candidatus Binatia bacterium]